MRRPGTPRRAFAALVLAVAALPSPSPSRAEPELEPAVLARRIETYLAPFIADGHLSGTLLVARGELLLYQRSFGLAHHELNVPNTPETRFCVASVTKPMTIALACRLVDQGRIHPDNPLSKWLPDFPRGDTITVSHLLNHRACIPHRVTTTREETVPFTAAEMVERVRRKPPLPLEPGERSVYSSAGFSVLARILELAGGASYGELLEAQVFRPAGMTRSDHADSRGILAGRAQPYLPVARGLVHAPLKDLSFLVGAGSVWSTSADLHAMIRALLDGRLGETAKLALLRENGLRWNGSTNGFRAFADYHKESGLVVVFAGNLHTGAVDLLREAVPRLATGEEVPTRERLAFVPVAVDPAVLKRYEGFYEAEHGASFSVRERGGALYAGDWLLVPTSSTTFFAPQDYGKVEVIAGADGQVERLDWAWTGGVMPWRRNGDPRED